MEGRICEIRDTTLKSTGVRHCLFEQTFLNSADQSAALENSSLPLLPSVLHLSATMSHCTCVEGSQRDGIQYSSDSNPF